MEYVRDEQDKIIQEPDWDILVKMKGDERFCVFDGVNLFSTELEKIKIVVETPLMRTGKFMELYVCSEEVNLVVGKFYRLNLGLPVAVKKSSCVARFCPENRQVEIILDRKVVKKQREVYNEEKTEVKLSCIDVDIDQDMLEEVF